MKKNFRISIVVLFFAGLSYSQEVSVEKVRTAVDNLFTTCKVENIDAAANQIAYTGKDDERNMSGLYDINDKKEASKVKRIVKKVAAFLKISDKYEFGSYAVINDEGKQIHTIEVLFISGEQELTTSFSFVNVKNNLLLTDINWTSRRF